jgi:hypothetical protein
LVLPSRKNRHGQTWTRVLIELVFEALNAIAYRFVALAEYDQSFTCWFNAHRDGQPFRYHQERDLFGFFSNAYSVFEGFCFTLFAVGALIDPARFPLTTAKDERNVNWRTMREAYCEAFSGDSILTVLKSIADDAAFKELGSSRHILTHRAVGARQLSAGTGPSPTLPEDLQWSQIELATGRLHVRRAKNGSPRVHPDAG